MDLGNIGFMLNLDMIGRNSESPVEIYGDGLAEGLTELVETANEKHELRLALQGKKFEPFSDIAVFHDNRIPFLMFFTGAHPDYHGTGDHAEKLDYRRMEKLLRLSYDILDLAAGAERLPMFTS
jgi:Zn-dependent M28 family amino/carboxypeptidase